jgi:DNA-directed RNA polymerase specialized sigma subunit
MNLRQRLEKIAAKDPFQFPTTWGQKDPSGNVVPFQGKAAEEIDLWRQWKSSNEDPDKLQPLLNSLNPVISAQVNRHAPPRMYRPAIEAEARALTVKALRKYDPSRGAQITTHVTTNLRGLNRFVKKHQNFTRIVEAQAHKIGEYQRTQDGLAEELGRPPTSLEIADRMKISVKKVERLKLEMRPDIFVIPTATEDGGMGDMNPFTEISPVHREIIEMLPYELTTEEQYVFNHLFGLQGKKKTHSTGDIAKALGWSDSKVSQVKAKIAEKYKTYEASF